MGQPLKAVNQVGAAGEGGGEQRERVPGLGAAQEEGRGGVHRPQGERSRLQLLLSTYVSRYCSSSFRLLAGQIWLCLCLYWCFKHLVVCLSVS